MTVGEIEVEIRRFEAGKERLRQLVWDETSEKLDRLFDVRLAELRGELIKRELRS